MRLRHGISVVPSAAAIVVVVAALED